MKLEIIKKNVKRTVLVSNYDLHRKKMVLIGVRIMQLILTIIMKLYQGMIKYKKKDDNGRCQIINA